MENCQWRIVNCYPVLSTRRRFVGVEPDSILYEVAQSLKGYDPCYPSLQPARRGPIGDGGRLVVGDSQAVVLQLLDLLAFAASPRPGTLCPGCRSMGLCTHLVIQATYCGLAGSTVLRRGLDSEKESRNGAKSPGFCVVIAK